MLLRIRKRLIEYIQKVFMRLFQCIVSVLMSASLLLKLKHYDIRRTTHLLLTCAEDCQKHNSTINNGNCLFLFLFQFRFLFPFLC